MKAISRFFTCNFLLLLFAGFTEVKVQHSKLSFVSTFYNNGTITIPYVEISDNNGSDNATNITPGGTSNLILFGNPTGIVEATVQIPANHPAGRVYLTRDDNPSIKIDCKTFPASKTNDIILSLFDNNPSGYEYDIYYEEGAGLTCP